MNADQFGWYQQAIAHEIDTLSDDFVGNVDFKFNIKAGNIANMNIVLSKSVRMPDVSRVT